MGATAGTPSPQSGLQTRHSGGRSTPQVCPPTTSTLPPSLAQYSRPQQEGPLEEAVSPLHNSTVTDTGEGAVWWGVTVTTHTTHITHTTHTTSTLHLLVTTQTARVLRQQLRRQLQLLQLLPTSLRGISPPIHPPTITVVIPAVVQRRLCLNSSRETG